MGDKPNMDLITPVYKPKMYMTEIITAVSLTISIQMADILYRTISALPQAYMNFNVFGRRIIQMNDDQLNKYLLKCIVMLSLSQEKFNILPTNTPRAVLEKMQGVKIPDEIKTQLPKLDIFNDEGKNKQELYKILSAFVNIAIFYLNENKHYKIWFPYTPKNGKWLVLVDSKRPAATDTSFRSIGVLSRNTRLIGSNLSKHDIANLLLDENEFVMLLNKYKPQGADSVINMQLNTLGVGYLNVANDGSESESGIIPHGIKRAYGKAKKIVRILNEDGATLSRTGTYTAKKRTKNSTPIRVNE